MKGHRTFCGMQKIGVKDKMKAATGKKVTRRKWFGAVAAGTKVVFCPDAAQVALVLETATHIGTHVGALHNTIIERKA